jgi:hypothetical protein
MSLPSEAAFARRYRALSPAERRDFVAALWAARGWETTRADDDAEDDPTVVVARRDGRTRRIAVGTPVPADVDAVVGDGTRRVLAASPRRRAEAVGATYLSPAALRERLCYGLDRDAADRLFRRHFGVDLAGAAAADSANPQPLRRRLSVAGRAAVAEVRPALGAVAVAALVLAAVAVLAVGGPTSLAGVAGLGPGAGDVDSTPSPPADGEYAAAADAIGTADSAARAVAGLDDAALGLDEDGLTGTIGSTARTPPGAFLTGVHDAGALADAHAAAVRKRSPASFVLVASGPANATDLPSTTGGRVGIAGDGGVEMTVASATRYRVVSSANASIASPAGEGPVETFADGDAAYRRTAGPDGVETSRLAAAEAPNGTAIAAAAAKEPIRRFLNGSDSTVRAAATERPLYRIDVRGEPAALDSSTVDDFRAVAFVTADGLVLELSAEYVHEPTGERVRVAFRYDRFGDAAVIPPPWYEEVEPGGDGGSDSSA